MAQYVCIDRDGDLKFEICGRKTERSEMKCYVATKEHWNKTKLRLTNYGLGG